MPVLPVLICLRILVQWRLTMNSCLRLYLHHFAALQDVILLFHMILQDLYLYVLG